MKRNRVLLVVLLCIIIISGVGFYLYYKRIQAQTKQIQQQTNTYFPISKLQVPCATNHIDRDFYSFEYVEEHEQSLWVAYMLTKDGLTGNEKRSHSFYTDPLVLTGSATNQDYSKSGYDKGHLAPAGDMKSSPQAMKESFFFSNISPQLPGFNRGIWKTLEEQVRVWAQLFDTLYIVTGPILKTNLPTIGNNNVSIPNYFYKAILVYSNAHIQGIAFIMPHASSNNSIYSYAVPIDSVETCIQRDLFCKLPDDVEHQIEGGVQIAAWK